MKIIAQARMPDEFLSINQYLHDLWFDIPDVQYDHSQQKIILRFFYEKQPVGWFGSKGNKVDYWLEIKCVNNMKLEDSQRIERYDFNELVYFHNTNILRVKTGIPLTFDIMVSGIDIVLYEQLIA